MTENFAQAAERYLDWYQAEHSDRPTTWLRVRTSFASFQEFRDLSVSAITPAIVEQYKCGRRAAGVKPVTLRHDLHALSGFFRFAVVMGWATHNPVSSVRIPSDRDAVRLHALTPEEEQRYLDSASVHTVLYANARLMLGTGIRPAEVLALRVGDVDRSKRLLIIRQGKTRAARRSIRLVGSAWDVARDASSARNSRDWLFPSPKMPGKPWTKLNGPHRRACLRAQLQCCLYDLRHTFATRMASRGMPLTTLAAILGHSSLRCVTRYVHPSQQVMDEAMERFLSVA